MKVGVPFRWTFFLVMLLGCDHVSSDETNGGHMEDELRKAPQVPDMAAQVPELSGVATALEGDDRFVEDVGTGSGTSAKGDGKASELVDADAVRAEAGDCVGRRFKKCR